jgi:type I restriction enzyme R subunit
MATGTGKTVVAFQICWKLSEARWNRTGEYRRPRILYLADRNILIDDPKDKTFTPFGDARWKIQGEAVKGRQTYRRRVPPRQRFGRCRPSLGPRPGDSAPGPGQR